MAELTAAPQSVWDGRVSAKHYVVACMDILGQRAEFARLPRFLKDGTTTEAALPALQRTYGRVHQFRRDFEEIFRAVNEQLAGVAWKEAVGSTLSSNEIGTYSFADTVIAYMRFGPEPANCYGVTAMVAASALVLLAFLARGVPVRGGIEVDWASPIGDKEIYGPALIEAHRLEGVAGHTRVAVGKGLLDYLGWAAQLGDSSKLNSMTVACATDCRKLLFRDNDGQIAVDHLGSVVDMVKNESTNWPGVARSAAEFIRSQQQLFAKSGDAKLAVRYTLALRYCDSRAVVWKGQDRPQDKTTSPARRPVEEQGAVYDAASKFLFGRDVKLLEMSYDWASGLLRFGASGAVEPSTVRDLQAHLVTQGFLVSSVISEPHKV